jgi:protein-S-isoprenylcysteine O-methyltransferase Ste14
MLRAWIVVPAVIGTLTGTFGVTGYFTTAALGLPQRLDMPLGLRAAGLGLLLLGAGLMTWILRYRRPVQVVASTYETMRKAVRKRVADSIGPRSEPLIVAGPQRLVRHPMYLAVVLLWLGWWLTLDYTLLLFVALFFCLWFNLVVIPFEERELRALCGNRYEEYARSVPRFFPWWRPSGR